ncbi:hypothetical protein [Serratia marcescens]|uniref:hypothetical protein n=1 Tax=Serratia marcescens TaxID=615 RepID=UPI002361E8C6|nr:hypothetical protein [Serratia marcescens]
MREFGFLLLAIGVVWLLIAFNMDTYVFTGYGERVNNIGLIASKQNHLLISSVISICAILMIIFGKSSSKATEVYVQCPFCAEKINPEAIKCKHCGSDVSAQLKAQKENKFSFHGFDHNLLLSNDDSPSLNDSGVMDLANKIKSISKSNRGSYIFGEHQSDITYIKYKLPKAVQDEFVKRLKYWLTK